MDAIHDAGPHIAEFAAVDRAAVDPELGELAGGDEAVLAIRDVTDGTCLRDGPGHRGRVEERPGSVLLGRAALWIAGRKPFVGEDLLRLTHRGAPSSRISALGEGSGMMGA